MTLRTVRVLILSRDPVFSLMSRAPGCFDGAIICGFRRPLPLILPPSHPEAISVRASGGGLVRSRLHSGNALKRPEHSTPQKFGAAKINEAQLG